MSQTTEETKLRNIDGVQVYARKNEEDKPSEIDAIDLDQAKIEAVADRLFRRGYGVMRRKKMRAGTVHYLLKATWVGPGQPPDDPFEGV
jgi:hypothetical protein